MRAPSASGSLERRPHAPPRTSARTAAAGRDRGRARPSRDEHYYAAAALCAPAAHGDHEDDRHPHRDPGPRSPEILERKQRVIANAKALDVPDRRAGGRGATLTDVDGNVFIDFTGGVGCLNVGHAHPRVVAAAQEQLERFVHTDFTVVPYEIYVELAERLLERAPFRGPAKAAFFNAGTEAVENAVKFARALHRAPGRDRVRGRLPRPHAALAHADLEDAPVQGRASARSRPRSTACRSRTPTAAPTPTTALAALERAVRRRTSPPRTSRRSSSSRSRARAASSPAPPEFVQGLRAICDQHGIVPVADEVQTGFARTGSCFAMEHYGVEPDLITVAKSIAAGPAALGRARQGRDHGRRRTTAPSAAPSSATRSRRRPRSPCST